MNRDPLYRKIAEALAGPLDGNSFERCAQALLGEAYPTLAPVTGGSDAGMDGAFGIPEGSFPLICTVRANVLGNFRKNASTYLAKYPQCPKRAVVGTSQQLTGRKRLNLEKAAKTLGLTIVNIHDAAYFADQLYRHSKWRMELLGISGNPPALSTLPRIGRFVQPDILIGRNEDVAWLRRTPGDILLVGQPGSGKTYLHQHLASQGLCLFAINDSPDRLADAIRDQQPSIIVVDDAHFNLRLVEDLKRLRADLDVEFQIHLNCWPDHEHAVQRILNIPNGNVRRLQLLTRRQVLELIKDLGINGPDWLQYLLIEQADGKPGLAVALAELCKTEDIARIWSGEATAAQLLGNLRLVPGERQRRVLAAFAVGGDVGMTFAQVAAALDLSAIELAEITAGLASGGLVEQVDKNCLQVRPPAIRPLLVRDVFYGGATSQPIAPLLDGTSCVASTASVLLSARQRGAAIDQSVLEAFVSAANTQDVWGHFACVDTRCADAILDKYPQHACHAAPGLLHHLPRRALHALLDVDELNLVPRPGAVEHPRRRIGEWLFPIDEAPNVTIDRRLILLSVLEERVRTDRIGSGQSYTWALAEILQASFDTVKASPGNNREFVSIRGVASQSILERIAGLWPRVRELFRHVPNAAARLVFDQLENWCLPQRLSLVSRITEETFQLVQACGSQMLSDVLDMPRCNRAWRTRAAAMAKWGKLDLQIRVDPAFDALFADRDHAIDAEAAYRKRIDELRALADELMKSSIDEVLQFAVEIASEAREFGYRKGSGHLYVLYHHIAQSCANPLTWIESLIVHKASNEFLMPFVDRLSLADPAQYQAVLSRLLDCPDYQPPSINRVLRIADPNEGLLSQAIALLDDPVLAEHLWLPDPAIPLAVMARLLDNPNQFVRAVAAIGEWQREPSKTVRPELGARWRLAIRDVSADHYALVEIIENDPTLAFEWLRAQIESGNRRLSIHDHALSAAANALNKDQRSELIRLFTRDNYSEDCFDMIMGEHTDLYAVWLEHQTDQYFRLAPLDRDVGPRWEQMAVLALDAGVSPEDLIHHCLPNHWTATGPFSQPFLERLSAYEALANHPDPRLRAAGVHGLSFIQDNAQRELEKERREEVYGG